MFNNQTAGSVAESVTPEVPKENKQIKALEAKVERLKEEVSFLKEQALVVKDSKPPQVQETPKRQVQFAQLHKAIFYPQLGQLPDSMDTSPSSQQPKLRGLKMYATDYGLEVELRGRTGFIPWGNVAHCAFKLLDKEAAKEADKHTGPNSVAPGYAGPSKLGTATVTAK